MCSVEGARSLGRVVVSRSRCIYRNLAYEEFLLRNHDCEKNGEVMLLWSNRPVVVIGRHQNPWLEANLPYLKASKIDLARRHSGGGTVYHDEGNLNVSLLTTHQRHCRKRNLEWVANALNNQFNLKGRIRTNATRSCRAAAVGFLQQDDKSATLERVQQTIIEAFSNSFQKVEEAAVDVDEEAETNDQVRAALTELTSPEWIFGKTPSFEVYTVEKSRMISVAKGKVTEAADECLIGKLLTIDVNI